MIFEALIKLANELDSKGFSIEADQIDQLIKEAASAAETLRNYFGSGNRLRFLFDRF